jgi:hypothetical protein
MQTPKNRWLLLGLLLACIVGVVLIVLVLLPRPGVTKENFDRIQNGMTRAEVEAIFGREPSGVELGEFGLGMWETADGREWSRLRFDRNDRVFAKRWTRDRRTILEKFLDLLSLREERPRRPVISIPSE